MLNSTTPATQQTVNSAWRKMQEDLAVKNFSRLINTVKFSNIPAVAVTDPSIYCYIDWDGYFDGNAVDDTITLPTDMISPLRLRERVVAEAPVPFTPMEYNINGLTGLPKQARNYAWLWDDEKLYFPGSTEIMDMELRYARYLADFEDDAGPPAVDWYNQPIPIMRAGEALAWYIAFEAANARGDVDSAPLLTQAQAAVQALVDREAQNDALRGEWTVPDIPAQAGNTPYDTVSYVWNVARARLNSVSKIAADIMTIQQPFAQQCFNNAWRKMQNYLADKGLVRFYDEILIEGLPPTVATDPAVQVYIDWSGYFDGSTVDTDYVLPNNLIMPVVIWERQNGTNAMFVGPMEKMLDGIPSIPQRPFNCLWEWRIDRVYMPGATFTTDLKIRYAKYLDDFVQTDDGEGNITPWYLQQVPLVRCSDSLALYLCAEIAAARPDLGFDPLTFKDQAEVAARQIYNRDVRQNQRVNARRMSRSGRLEGTAAYGAVYRGA